ncbi:DUF6067 family protein [bacterium]|nr:DUF6067 family protein [bacterium]
MRRVAFLALLLTIVITQTAFASGNFQVWVSDPLVNIMQDTAKPSITPTQINVTAARNEYESAQVVVTPSSDITALTASVSSISGPANPKPTVSLNFVGYVPVEHGTPYTPSENLVATAPTSFPDPLLESTSVSVTAPNNQPIWLTVRIPLNAKPGTYTGTVTVIGDGTSISVPLMINVASAILPDKRTFKCTNWLSYDPIADYYNTSLWSTKYWTLVSAYAQCMAKHRMNVHLTRINKLIVGHQDDGGNLTFDFTRFDKWVQTFLDAGALDIIEGGHLSGRKSWEGTDYYVWYPDIYDTGGSNVRPHNIIATSDQARQFFSVYLPAVQQHLIDKGWIDMYIQHVGDEPLSQSAASYRNVAAIVRQYAPQLKIVDAVETTDLVGAIDIWVPQPQDYAANSTFYEQRKAAGDEVWIYTCLTPKGLYMNRFVDYPLIDTRLLHWANYKYKLPGYLHWGFNAWHGDPFTNIEMNYGSTTTAFDPPGDTHIAYKATNGPMSSIRLEALRDGIEDYELLKLLEKTNPTRAQLICDSVVTSWTSYTRDPATFRAARAQLLSSLTENAVDVTQVKSLPAGSSVFLTNGVITGDLRPPSGSLDLFYVEKDDRTSGIGILSPGSASYTAGQRADIFGKTSILDGAELVIEPDAVSVCSGTAIGALAMTNKASGGSGFGDQPGVYDDASLPAPISSLGASSIGKLVRTWGEVTGSGETFLGTVFWINDGSDLKDGFTTSQGNASSGLGVLMPPGLLYIPSGFVTVTGILRAVPNPSGLPVRLLVPRNNSSDISN